ncbi:Fatty acid desaturase [Rhodoferax sp. OV413]|uniref:fatty acid desaturase n=1 Tax=Rhodoferax sp. OV413 TaxID=1855285 RepID=UPI000885093D|nr:fatty acid desaturase [Rhodoferax sp. OV413]SDO28152.1 Fatty acid desaturase [Rhodoferax sp. OV413]
MPTPSNRYALRGDADLPQPAPADPQWFSPSVDRKLLKQLMQRNDRHSLWNYGLWLALLLASGTAGVLTWGSWWCVPAFALYGILYASSDHRAHELSHGTPFKTRWLNEMFYQLAGFMTLHEGHYWRWSHTRHHTHTMMVGRDAEIAVQQPVSLGGLLADLFFLKSGAAQIANIVRHAFGRISADGLHFIPAQEQPKVIRASRIYLAIFIALAVACVLLQSVLPLMLVVGPRFYGGALTQLFNLTQHAGLAENVYDHRHSTRTFHTHAVFRFLYANMNYHLEHHMFPMVPYHALPQLHAAIQSECPAPATSLWDAYREILPALLQQVKQPGYAVVRPMSVAANK